MRSIAVVCSAVIGVAFLMSPAFAQEKTAKACQAEWRANKADNQAKGITEKAYVAKCRGGDSAAKPAPAPAASTAKEKKEKKTTAAAAPAATEKTAKACRDEWRANKADNQAKGITEKAYVTQCRAGTAAAQPAPAPARGKEGDRGTRAGSCCGKEDDRSTRAGACTRARKEDGDRSHGTAARRDGANRRQPVHDRSASQGAMRDRNGRVGQPGFEDLSLRVIQELRQHEIRRVYVRAGCDRPGNARLQKREASLSD